MNKHVLVPFTDGVEEVELVTIVDLLRRAGLDVCMASLNTQTVTGRSGITITADAILADVMQQPWDMLVLPGGLPNAQLLRDDKHVKSLAEQMHREQKAIAAICAAPTALAAYGITSNRRVTSYPACQSEMQALQPSCTYMPDPVVEDGFLITSRGPGTAIDFALCLITRLCGQHAADSIQQEIVA